MTSEVPAVIVGLGVGIALIAVFAWNYHPAHRWSNQEIIEYAHTLDEVQAFYETASSYHLQPTEQIRSEGNVAYADYAVTNTYRSDDGDPTTLEDLTASNELRLRITMGSSGDIVTELVCNQDPSLRINVIVFHATSENIRNSDCLEFDNDVDSGMDSVTEPLYFDEDSDLYLNPP